MPISRHWFPDWCALIVSSPSLFNSFTTDWGDISDRLESKDWQTDRASGLTPFSINDMQMDKVCRSRSAFYYYQSAGIPLHATELPTSRVEISWKTSITWRACACVACLSCLFSPSGILWICLLEVLNVLGSHEADGWRDFSCWVSRIRICSTPCPAPCPASRPATDKCEYNYVAQRYGSDSS